MGLFNFKEKLQELEANNEPTSVDLEETGPQTYSVFERSAIDLPRLVQPESVDWKKDYYQVGDEYCRTLFVHSFPPAVEDNWLAPIMSFPHAIDVAMYVTPHNIKNFLHEQRHQLAQDEAALARDAESGIVPNHKKVARTRDTLQLIEAIEEDITKPFQVMLALTLRARSPKELDRLTELLEGQLSSMHTRRCTYRHKQGFDTTMPLMNNELQDMQCMHTLHTQAIMASFPFSNNDITHEEGVLIGTSTSTSAPIVLNRFMQPQVESPNTAILGASGSGKSFFAKLEMLRWSYHGKPVVVLDPSGEYERVAEGVGGSNINITLDSGQHINPLDFSHAVSPTHNALRAKVTFLVEFVGVLLRGDRRDDSVIYDAVSRQIVSNALQETYRSYKYLVADPSSQMAATPERMPTLSELYLMLQRIQRTNRDPQHQKRLQPMMAGLARYVGDGDLAPLFDHRTNIDARSHFLNFNYHGLQEEYLPMAMHLVLEFLRTSLFTDEQRESGQNRLLYVDEAQILMSFPETAHFLQYTARTCRKYGVGLTVMTQNVGVFVLDSEGSPNVVGQAILANCSIKVLLKQEPSEADAVRMAFNLTDGELSRLLGSRSGEGLVKVGRDSAWFTAHGLASPLEYPLLTTTTTERARLVAEERAALAAAEENIFEVEEDERFLGANALPPGSPPELPAAPPDNGASSPFDSDPFA